MDSVARTIAQCARGHPRYKSTPSGIKPDHERQVFIILNLNLDEIQRIRMTSPGGPQIGLIVR